MLSNPWILFLQLEHSFFPGTMLRAGWWTLTFWYQSRFITRKLAFQISFSCSLKTSQHVFCNAVYPWIYLYLLNMHTVSNDVVWTCSSFAIRICKIEFDRYIGRYLGFTDILVSAKMANFISLSRCWPNAVIFLTHPDNLCKKAQWTRSRLLQERQQVRFCKQTDKINHGPCVGCRSWNKSIIWKLRNVCSYHM